MIDHICSFTDETTAVKALPQFHPEGWNRSIVIPGVSAIDAANKSLPGWRLNISLDGLDKSLPGLEVAFDRGEADKGEEPFVVVSIYTPEELADLTFSPVFAGSKVHDRVEKVREDVAKESDPAVKAEVAEAIFTEEAKADVP